MVVRTEDLPKAKEYLRKRIVIDETTECHTWQLHKNRNGYGIGNWNRKTELSHRLSYAIANDGFIPLTNENGKKLQVRHGECCEADCCNSEHLKIGTAAENMADKIEKGTHLIGEKHPRATISEETAIAIIDSWYPPDHEKYLTQKERALNSGVLLHIVQAIDWNTTWKYLPRKLFDKKEKKEKRITSKRRRKGVTLEEENKAKSIIVSKKHKYDPEYRTQEQRAFEFGVSVSTVRGIDRCCRWQSLPRHTMIIFPKPQEPIWTLEQARNDFERVKDKCVYSENVNEIAKTKCLEWTKALVGGRPYVYINNRESYAYTFSCELGKQRPKKKEEEVRHLCNNRICCEPSHLEFGSKKDNAADALRFGVSKGFKLSYERAETIRRMFNEGVTRKELAYTFKVGRKTISSVINRKRWVATQ